MIMKLQNIPFLLMVAILVLASCKGKERKQMETPKGTAFEQQLSGQDTAAVEALVDRFFGYVLDKQFAEAAAMLYRNDTDKDQTPVELNNEEMDEVCGMLESIPMVDYKIEYIKFSEYYSNEVLCRVVIREAEGDMPPVTTKMYFKPVNCLGNWVLCLTNTAYGDKGLIKNGKAHDTSLENRNKERKEEMKAQQGS